MSDEMTALLNDVAPGLKDAGAAPDKAATQELDPSNSSAPVKPGKEPKVEHPEDFDDAEYENDSDEAADTDKVRLDGRKAWPKKYVNALTRRDNELREFRAERAAREQAERLKQTSKPSANNGDGKGAQEKPAYNAEQEAELKAVLDKKPKLEEFKDYGEYMEALTDWKVDVRETQRDLNDAIQKEANKNSEAQAKAATENEARIAKQSKELIEKHPEYLELVQANADILASFDHLPNVLNAFGMAKHPELAFIALANTEGALQALAKMDAASALQYVARAEVIGAQIIAQAGGTDGGADAGHEEPETQRSKAPVPMKAAKGTRSGAKQMANMDADELDEVLGFSKF